MSILFLSTRNYGLTPDMKILNSELEKRGIAADVRIINTKKSGDKLTDDAAKRLRKNQVLPDDDVIAIDGSLPDLKKKANFEFTSKILIPIEYDYQFKQLLKPSEKKYRAFNAYSHIVSPSPLTTGLITKYYERPDYQELIEGFCSPFGYDICTNTEKKEEVYGRLCRYFPEAKGKKIIAVLNAQRYDIKDDWKMNNLDLAAFLDEVKDEYFVVTNSGDMLESAAYISSERKDSFCFTEDLIKSEELLYIADVLISNNCYLLSAFAAKRKPLYVLADGTKNIEAYAAKYFPSLIFGDCKTVAEQIKNGEYTEEQKKLNSLLSYPPQKNSADEIIEILGY